MNTSPKSGRLTSSDGLSTSNWSVPVRGAREPPKQRVLNPFGDPDCLGRSLIQPGQPGAMPMVFGQFDLDLLAALMKGTGPTLSDRLHHYKVPAEATRDWSDDLVQICLEDRLLERSSQVAALDPSKVAAPAAASSIERGVRGKLRQGCAV